MRVWRGAEAFAIKKIGVSDATCRVSRRAVVWAERRSMEIDLDRGARLKRGAVDEMRSGCRVADCDRISPATSLGPRWPDLGARVLHR